jgi:LytS/YehU family sensor histidine kinase
MWPKLSVFWKYQVGGWATFIIIFFPLKILTFGSVGVATHSLHNDATGFLLTLGMHEIYRRISFRTTPLHGIFVIVVLLSLVCGSLESIFINLFHRFIDHPWHRFTTTGAIWGVRYYQTSLLLVWSFAYFIMRLIYESAEKDSRLEAALRSHRTTELQMLRGQMNPHFLFNALNTICHGLEKPGVELKKIVHSLADYLRFSLDHGSEDFVSLGEEYDAMKDYLEVEKSRFRDDLLCECHLDETLRSIPVPGILLQPLVENAIKYGRDTSEFPMQVKVFVSRVPGGILQITVSNSGHWVSPTQSSRTIPMTKSSHLGLKNLRRRLKLQYPDNHEVKIQDGNGWVTVAVELPLER